MEVSITCNFDSEFQLKEIKKKFMEIARQRDAVCRFDFEDLYDLKLPVKALIRDLAKITGPKNAISFKIIVYAIWIPILPLVLLAFYTQALVKGNKIKEELKKEPRYRICGDHPIQVKEALVILREFLDVTKGLVEVSFSSADERDWKSYEDTGGEPEYISRLVSRDEFMKVEPREILEKKFVQYRIL